MIFLMFFEKNYKTTFTIECIDGQTYISLRVLITFKNQPVELKIRVLVNVYPNLDDDVYQCDVNDFFDVAG